MRPGKSITYQPDRGEVIWITLNPQSGHEQAGRRPALVLSPRDYNARVGLALLCPITSHVKGYPFEGRVPEGHPGGGASLADQVKSLDWRARAAERMCSLPMDVVIEVLGKLSTLLE